MSIPSKTGLYLVVPGFVMQNGKVIKAFASVANVVEIYGWVNTLVDA
jgi:hypothetical protein